MHVRFGPLLAGLAVLGLVGLGLTACGPGPTCFGRKATMVAASDGSFLIGTANTDVIVGLGGHDDIEGGGGIDYICGGGGSDRIGGNKNVVVVPDSQPADGGNFIDGGDGQDWIEGTQSRDQLLGGANDDIINSYGGGDSVDGGSHDGPIPEGDSCDVNAGDSVTNCEYVL